MRASQLLLDRYWVDELCFSYNEKYRFESQNEPVLLPEDLEVTVEPARNPDDPLQWYFKLSVRLDDKAQKFPYRFSVKLTGFFAVHKDCPPGDAEQLALVNSPSILYASAREVLAMATGRGRMLSMILPSITFYEPPKKEAKAKEAPKQKAKENQHQKAIRTRKKGGTRVAAKKK